MTDTKNYSVGTAFDAVSVIFDTLSKKDKSLLTRLVTEKYSGRVQSTPYPTVNYRGVETPPGGYTLPRQTSARPLGVEEKMTKAGSPKSSNPSITVINRKVKELRKKQRAFAPDSSEWADLKYEVGQCLQRKKDLTIEAVDTPLPVKQEPEKTREVTKSGSGGLNASGPEFRDSGAEGTDGGTPSPCPTSSKSGKLPISSKK